MNHFFIDTNVIIDFLADRKPFSETAENLFKLSEQNLVRLYVASLSFANTYYLLRQQHTHHKTIDLLSRISKYVQIMAIDANTIDQSLKSDFSDFEDAIQNYCAESDFLIEAIITRDPKGFKKSRLPILNPEAALILIQKT